ncbi:hypothetical protein DL95DRAFT_449150 [Leptodontidium sp. 2 PMI_412]|nr:hypothetical protein DL95DRAFT_449150 [Leptodontidium sp. 2 PMI_412]
MSTEVAKKRGRPKKVISDPVEVGVEMQESAKKKVGTTRAKSTKTVAKATKAAKGDGVKKSVVKAGGASAGLKSVPKIEEAPGKSGGKEGGKATPATPATTTRSSTTTATATSKILEQVKEMEARKEGVSQESAKEATAAAGKGLAPEAAKEVERSQQELVAKQSTEASKAQSRATAKSNPVPPQQKPSSSSKSPDPKIAAKQPPPPQPPVGKATPPPSSPPPSSPPPSAKPTPAPAPKPTPTPTTKPHVPLAQLNSTIVSNIATRAGARPNTPGSQQLPKNYKPVARKVTMAIVALPILIVTSYVLYQRLVLGEEKKMLVQPQQNPVRGEVKKAEPPSTSSAESS